MISKVKIAGYLLLFVLGHLGKDRSIQLFKLSSQKSFLKIGRAIFLIANFNSIFAPAFKKATWRNW